jgi:hypothetical protein
LGYKQVRHRSVKRKAHEFPSEESENVLERLVPPVRTVAIIGNRLWL